MPEPLSASSVSALLPAVNVREQAMRVVWFILANAWIVPVVSYILTGRPRWMAE